MNAVACCGGGWRGASSSCAHGRARRTRSRRCCSAACRASRRARTCSGSRAAGGWPGWSCPPEERESVDAGIRHIDFLDAEIAAVERLIAQQALNWPEIRRLMTVPGVNLRQAERQLAAQAEASYKQLVTDRQAAAPTRKVGASVTAERA
jgi:hypothetical protein